MKNISFSLSDPNQIPKNIVIFFLEKDFSKNIFQKWHIFRNSYLWAQIQIINKM